MESCFGLFRYVSMILSIIFWTEKVCLAISTFSLEEKRVYFHTLFFFIHPDVQSGATQTFCVCALLIRKASADQILFTYSSEFQSVFENMRRKI